MTGLRSGRGAGQTGQVRRRVLVGNAGISGRTGFDAVAERETMRKNPPRRNRSRAYQLSMPARCRNANGATGPNIVAYALMRPNELGQERYSRRCCPGRTFIAIAAKYRSPTRRSAN